MTDAASAGPGAGEKPRTATEKTMTQDVMVSITRIEPYSPNDQAKIRIRVESRPERQYLGDLEVSLADFAAAVTGVAQVDGIFRRTL